MHTTEVINTIGIPHAKLYYLEQTGYIKPKKIPLSHKKHRKYTKQVAEKIRLIGGRSISDTSTG